MAEIARYRADTSLEIIGNAIEEHGAVVVEGLLDPPTLAELDRDIDPLISASDPAQAHVNETVAAFFGKHVRHLTGLAGKSDAFAEKVMCHPVYLALCDRFLLPNCADYQLNLGHMMDRGPGAHAQTMHRDEDLWIHFRHPRPILQLATVVALVDFTRENGATLVVPGSHRWSRERQPEEAEIAFAEMPAGSAVIYQGATLHAGGANATSDQWRRGFHMSYALGWLRTEENNVLSVPPARARRLSRQAQRLLGYGVHDAIKDNGGYLGMVDLRNPLDLLSEGQL
ncbi:phytanoyl-CoA dioxygenase family protein [Cupriavidus lacunae]|uniref:Mitomycin antibiotic biosynthesis protein n=1 Tax=Cupriavidus lacunae TaxID=2666307 RepID=A0A370NQV5_9BURK|nr:phytanoyl-CoA dioxygenase family protein [Cupriavidus lacunae]RDK08006.1 mitomycin antibiotic biosynthesis protein [Cupriavidus lacunae]